MAAHLLEGSTGPVSNRDFPPLLQQSATGIHQYHQLQGSAITIRHRELQQVSISVVSYRDLLQGYTSPVSYRDPRPPLQKPAIDIHPYHQLQGSAIAICYRDLHRDIYQGSISTVSYRDTQPLQQESATRIHQNHQLQGFAIPSATGICNRDPPVPSATETRDHCYRNLLLIYTSTISYKDLLSQSATGICNRDLLALSSAICYRDPPVPSALGIHDRHYRNLLGVHTNTISYKDLPFHLPQGSATGIH